MPVVVFKTLPEKMGPDPNDITTWVGCVARYADDPTYKPRKLIRVSQDFDYTSQVVYQIRWEDGGRASEYTRDGQNQRSSKYDLVLVDY